MNPRSVFVVLALGAAVTFATVVSAAGPNLRAKPFEFVGTAAICGVAGVDTVTAEWRTHVGLPDAGNSNHALFLQKLGPTSNCAAAGATIDGVAGITLTELGYDVKDGSHCRGGAPRFHVDASDGFHFVGACTNGTLVGSPAPGWSRYRFTLAQAFPPISPTATVKSISIVFDEGTDVGTGTALIDNIDINGTLIGKPGNN